MPVEPALGGGRVGRIEQFSRFVQVFGGVIVVNGLQTVIEVAIDQVPNPGGTIANSLGVIVLLQPRCCATAHSLSPNTSGPPR